MWHLLTIMYTSVNMRKFSIYAAAQKCSYITLGGFFLK